MLYVLKTINNDVILFDSITSFSESYSGSVTSHPIEDGSKISDHFQTDNLKIKIQGVVSDYNFFNPLKDALNTTIPAYNYDRSSSMLSLNDFESFDEGSARDIPQDYNGVDASGSFSVKTSAATVKSKLIEINRNGIECTILEYKGEGTDSVINAYGNCVITDLSFPQAPDSGYALYVDISIEQIAKVRVRVIQAKAEKIKVVSVSDAATPTTIPGVDSLKTQIDNLIGPTPKDRRNLFYVKKGDEIIPALLDSRKQVEYYRNGGK